jgi:hypothetical protein
MSLVLQVDILGEYKNLTAATDGAQKQLGNLNKKMSGISKSINRSLGAIGIGFSLGFIIREFDDMAKAAIDDSKSQAILKDTLQKTVDASDDQVISVEKSISKMQIQTGVLDDKLRPAFGKIIRSTQDLDLATGYMNLALDIAAGTGKDVEIVAQAMSRALGPNGTTGALEKLVPAIKGAKDPMGELEKLFDGAAKKAADTDPYNNLKIIFGEMQEQIGISLLPTLKKLSDWLSTPEGQDKLQKIVDGISEILTAFGKMAAWVIDNRDWLVPMVIAIGTVTAGWNLALGAAKAYAAFAGLGAIGTAAGAGVAGAVAGVAAGSAVGGFMEGQQRGVTSQIYGQGFKQLGSSVLGKNAPAPVVIQVKTVNDAKTTLDAISKFQKSTGTRVNLGQY